MASQCKGWIPLYAAVNLIYGHARSLKCLFEEGLDSLLPHHRLSEVAFYARDAGPGGLDLVAVQDLYSEYGCAIIGQGLRQLCPDGTCFSLRYCPSVLGYRER